MSQQDIAFATSVRLLIKMHELDIKGEKDTPLYLEIEGDHIQSWYELDESDCRRLDLLSEALLKTSQCAEGGIKNES